MSATHFEHGTAGSTGFELWPGAKLIDELAAYSWLRELRPHSSFDRIVDAGIARTIRASSTIDFANECEADFARALEANRILWKYKPRTFAVEWDDAGNFVDSFTPGFYLPGRHRYLELNATDAPITGIVRKVRLLRRHYPSVRIDLILWPGIGTNDQTRQTTPERREG